MKHTTDQLTKFFMNIYQRQVEKRLVPSIQEKEVDKYFAHFEKVVDSLNWPKESWVILLQSVLVGKAQEIYGSLSVEQSSIYENVRGNPQSLRASP